MKKIVVCISLIAVLMLGACGNSPEIGYKEPCGSADGGRVEIIGITDTNMFSGYDIESTTNDDGAVIYNITDSAIESSNASDDTDSNDNTEDSVLGGGVEIVGFTDTYSFEDYGITVTTNSDGSHTYHVPKSLLEKLITYNGYSNCSGDNVINSLVEIAKYLLEVN